MSVYLVDFENVNGEGLSGIERLGPDDVVTIFYSKNASTISFEMHQALNESKAQIDYLKVVSGTKNALDFQLVSYLGYLMALKPDATYYLVTKDKGYNAVVDFWKDAKKNVSLIANLKKVTVEQENNEIRKVLKPCLPDRKDQDLVISYVDRYKTKMGLNNALQKKFDSKKGGEIYKVLKPFIKDKKGN